MPEEIEFEEDARVRWANGETTRAMRAQAQQLVAAAQNHLHSACSLTTDPAVRGAYAEFLAMSVAVELLGSGNKKS